MARGEVRDARAGDAAGLEIVGWGQGTTRVLPRRERLGWNLPGLAGARIEELQAGHILEVAVVAGHKREIIRKSRSADQEVERTLAHLAPPLPQLSPKDGVPPRHRARDREDAHPLQEASEGALRRTRVARPEDALQYLAVTMILMASPSGGRPARDATTAG